MQGWDDAAIDHVQLVTPTNIDPCVPEQGKGVLLHCSQAQTGS